MISEKARREKLVTRLLEKAALVGSHGKPGDVIVRLSKEDRELLKTLTASDFQRRIK